MSFKGLEEVQYKHLKRVARARGISEEKLVQAFELERDFHLKIAGERDHTVRERLYYELYNTVLPLYMKTGSHDKDFDIQSKAKLLKVKVLRKELEGKSILDVGCGSGEFLRTVDANIEHGKLVGIDVSPVVLPREHENIEFVQSNAISFSTDCKFDVVFSDNFIEHIALPDLPIHLRSVKNAMVPGGTLIIITPNRLFGPHDVTNIIDATYTNKIEALGGHLHETTYTELVPILKDNGFSSFKTIIPITLVSYCFPNVRISPRFVQAVENRKYLLSAIYKCKILSIQLSWLQIVLLCTYAK
jgi:2-polyprenyl-3-methyl-5-hydroxy-6-metoxy-1,4-benzoquinol methylase